MLTRLALKWRREWPLDLYKGVLGLFLLASPWLFSFAYQGTRVEAWAVGLALLAVSVAALIAFVDVEEWLALALGLWLVAAPWLLGFKSPASRIHIAGEQDPHRRRSHRRLSRGPTVVACSLRYAPPWAREALTPVRGSAVPPPTKSGLIEINKQGQGAFAQATASSVATPLTHSRRMMWPVTRFAQRYLGARF
jgi:SPW repeat